MKKDHLGFALVGCGRIAQKYLELFKQNKIKRSKIVAVCDLSPEKARSAGKKLNVPSYSNMDEMMLNQKEIDVVVVLTESGLHAKHTIALAKYKKHIIVEKPMALRVKDAEKMINVCKKNNIKLFVVKQNRFNEPVQILRKAFDQDQIGKVFMSSTKVRWARNQDYYNHDKWRGTYAYDGGVFANQAAHYIDLIQWFLGQPKSVFAKGQRSFAKIEAEDTGVAIITFKNNCMAIIEATVATRPDNLEGSFCLLGDRGSIEVGGFALNEIKIWSIENHKLDKTAFSKPKDVYGFGHEKYLNHVVGVILSHQNPLVDGQEGLKTVLILEAIYESMATGKEINIGKTFRAKKSKLGVFDDKVH